MSLTVTAVNPEREFLVGAAIPELALEKCNGCGDCVERCPAGVVGVVNGKVAIVRPDECTYCADCEVICPSGAIRCPFEIVLFKPQPESASGEG